MRYTDSVCLFISGSIAPAYQYSSGAAPIIPTKANSSAANDDIDWCMCKYRYLVENALGRIKSER
jgi:hypothetical protein